MSAPDLPARQAERCEALLDDLPATVAGEARRVVTPSGAGAAWGDPAIVLTCRAGKPRGYVPEASCIGVDGVDWFIPEEQLVANGAEDFTMTTLFRRPNVEVRVPARYWPPATALADLSRTVARHVPSYERCL